MITKTLTFETFDGEKVTKTFSFHMNKSELLKWETENRDQSVGKQIQDAVNNKDPKGIFDFIYELILRSYGEKSDDGMSFVKTRNGVALRENFENSIPFDTLLDELLNDPDKLNAFIEHVFPAEVLKMGADQMEKEAKALTTGA